MWLKRISDCRFCLLMSKEVGSGIPAATLALYFGVLISLLVFEAHAKTRVVVRYWDAGTMIVP